MKSKFTIVFVIAVLALVMSACVPAAGGSAPVRHVSVAGSGTANLVPDMAYIYLGVHTELNSASESIKANNAQTEKVIAALTAAGIDSKDIRTSNFSVYPFDKYDPLTGTSTGEKFYAVDNTVYVTIRDLAKLGELLDAVVNAGANTVNSIQFDVADKDAALKQARADALADAKAKAEELASAAGVSLGEVQTINFADSQPFPLYDGFGRGGGGGDAAASAVPINPGQLSFTVTVNVTYEIK